MILMMNILNNWKINIKPRIKDQFSLKSRALRSRLPLTYFLIFLSNLNLIQGIPDLIDLYQIILQSHWAILKVHGPTLLLKTLLVILKMK